MDSQQDKTKDVFLAAVDILRVAEPQAHLEPACAGDHALRREVEDLLRPHQRMGSFLQPPAAPPTALADLTVVGERPGAVLGPYKLLEQIGEGGFGMVFLAEQ